MNNRFISTLLVIMFCISLTHRTKENKDINTASNYAAIYFGGAVSEFCEAIALDDTSITIFSSNTEKLNSGIRIENMDQTIRPQDDFFQYANGTWLKNTKIPKDRSSYGAFVMLWDKADQDIKKIIEESANKRTKRSPHEEKVAFCYESYMDSTSIEELGIKPLDHGMKAIDSVGNREELIKLFAYFDISGIQNPILFYVAQDKKNSDQYLTYLYQSGLGLPDKNYYINNDEKSIEIRNKYVDYIAQLFSLADIFEGEIKAKKILQTETNLAVHHWSNVQNRDPEKLYNKFRWSELNSVSPEFSLQSYLKGVGIHYAEEVIVSQVSYFKAFSQIFDEITLEDWKTYCKYKLLDSYARFLNSEFVDLSHDFYDKTLRGIEEIPPRWERAVDFTSRILGECIGKIYVKKHFRSKAKDNMLRMFKNIKLSFAERIKQLDWMSPKTKEQALDKLSKLKAKIGYPDKWNDYSDLEIKNDDLVGNYRRSNHFENKRQIEKLNRPVDRSEWFLNPQTVNAYYSSSLNEIVFPAAILQPPYFNFMADDAVNYGAIGAVIGHEITHGFDDEGRKSDGDGNIRDWWTEEDNLKFIERAQVMIDQFNNYSPLDNMHINGTLTLGENIADLGGLTIAYYAYKISLNGKEAPIIDGFTGEQRFFLGFAQVQSEIRRDESLRQRLLNNPHSPGKYRCNGVVSNMPEFYEAFNVSPGDPLYRPEEIRVKIW